MNILKENKILKWLIRILIIFLIIISIFISVFLFFEKIYYNKIYSGIKIANIDLSGKTIDEANKILNNKIDIVSQNGIKFEYNDKKVFVSPIITSLEAEFAYEIISFNTKQAVNKAFAIGREKDFIVSLQNKIATLIYGKQINEFSKINEGYIKNILYEEFKQFEIPANDAELVATSTIDVDNIEKIVWTVSNEKIGKVIDYEKAIKQLRNNLTKFDFSSIQLHTKSDYPKIFKNECLNIESKAQKIISSAPYILKNKEQKWDILSKDIAQWLILEKNNKDIIDIKLDLISIEEFLNKITVKIDKEVIDARFNIENNRVVEFRESKDGIKLNLQETINKIENKILGYENNFLSLPDYNEEEKINEIELVVEIIKSKANVENGNNLGIKEIIGTGHSNFAGSPSNRRHNIKVGADSVSGILIKPEEEFSLVRILGEINAESGYLPELVIKGNRTILEYGGGLCQIATTIFRTALNAGLPITARRNHSYRVSYYEPAGTDAAVYDPAPDIKFMNDTDNYILIQYRFLDNDLYFDFWGMKDGRSVEQTEPVIYNITKPRAAKIIETLDLAVGEKKCSEHAHNGADVYFDYKVVYSDGEVKEEKFYSHYVPWQEVCLIGVESLTETVE